MGTGKQTPARRTRDLRRSVHPQRPSSAARARDAQRSAGVLEVFDIAPFEPAVLVRRGQGPSRARVQVRVVVTRYSYLMGMRQRPEPIDLRLELGDRAGVGEVAGMD